MRKEDIVVGGVYLAKVSGQLVKVRVNDIENQTLRKHAGYSYNGVPKTYKSTSRTIYVVTNLRTGRVISFKSAGRFRKPIGEAHAKDTKKEEQTKE